MQSTNDLIREATRLAEQIRRHRTQGGRERSQHGAELATMEQQLRDLWTAIRAARVTSPPAGPLPFPRGSFSKVR